MNKVQNAQLSAAFKTSYSMLSQAILRMSTEEGPLLGNYDTTSLTNDSTKPVFAKEFAKYFNNVVPYDSTFVTPLTAKNYTTMSNGTMDITLLDDGMFSLMNGMTLFFELPSGRNHLLVMVDVNGYKKKPNKWGYDLFSFVLTDKDTLLPVGSEAGAKFVSSYMITGDTTNLSLFCDKASTSIHNGLSCAAKALTEKDYFKSLSEK